MEYAIAEKTGWKNLAFREGSGLRYSALPERRSITRRDARARDNQRTKAVKLLIDIV
jgi:hypothetical protein